MVGHHKRNQRIYMTNQLMDNFYVLSGIGYCLKNVLFRQLVNSMQNQVQSTK